MPERRKGGCNLKLRKSLGNKYCAFFLLDSSLKKEKFAEVKDLSEIIIIFLVEVQSDQEDLNFMPLMWSDLSP